MILKKSSKFSINESNFIIYIGALAIISFMVLMSGALSQIAEENSILLIAGIPYVMIYFLLAFTAYAITVYLIQKKNANKPDPLNQKKISKRKWVILILLTLLMRIPFLIIDPKPALSGDVYRYWWDGKVQSEGINPYHYSPEDFPNKDFKKGSFDDINHKTIPTGYGPFLEFIFFISYLIHPSIIGVKSVIILFDLLTIVMIIFWLKKRNIPREQFIIYAWSPLVILEFYQSGHSESILCFFIVLTAYLYDMNRKGWSLVSLAFLTLTKYFAIAFLPFYFKKIPLRYFLGYFIVLILFYIAYYDSNMFTGLMNYSKYWKFNGSLYKVLYRLFNDEQIPKLLLGVVFVLAYTFVWIKVYLDLVDLPKAFFIILALILLFSPVFYPWYILILLPLLVVYYSRSWVLLTGLVFLSYVVLIEYFASGKTIWNLSPIILFVEYLPFYALMIYDYVTSKTKIKTI